MHKIVGKPKPSVIIKVFAPMQSMYSAVTLKIR